MARARNIKPGFFANDLLAECEPLARLMFAGLWLHADREGRLEDRPKRLKAEILPYDECNADNLLEQLVKRGFIQRYEAAGVRYIQVTKFSEHQNPHVKESASSIPAPDKHSASPVQVTEIPATTVLIPDSLLPITDSLNPHTEASGADAPTPRRERSRSSDWTEEFAEFWNIYPRRAGDSRANAHKTFIARITKDKATPEQIIAGARRYAAFVAAMGTEPQFVKMAETFLGPGRHYESDWTPQPRASPIPYESAKDRKRRETMEALTGKISHATNDIIDINTPPDPFRLGG